MENKELIKPPEQELTVIPQQPINGQPSGLIPNKRRFLRGKLTIFRKRPRLFIALGILLLILLAGLAGGIWLHHELRPVGKNTAQLVEVTIASGSTPSDIGTTLQNDHIIRSSTAFDIYTRLTRTQNKLEAGTYRLSPAKTTPEIVQSLVKGTVYQFSITFLPGATLAQNRQVLLNAGYSASEVDTALAASYSSPLFANKPAGTTLEGYIYGETYDFNSGVSVGQILEATFSEYESIITKYNLVSAFAKQGLNLYQGITLASIIQREVSSPSDQKQVAQVFYSRLALGMPLGSDVTYIYAASILGVPATTTLDSPYNTLINVGLPPGPIAVPGLTALQAVAAPASGDYLYFLSGDDGKTYFATTEAQHEANIANYCKVKCSED